jgi:hypothetical protein
VFVVTAVVFFTLGALAAIIDIVNPLTPDPILTPVNVLILTALATFLSKMNQRGSKVSVLPRTFAITVSTATLNQPIETRESSCPLRI